MTIGHLNLRPPVSIPQGSNGGGSVGFPISPAAVTPLSEARRELLADIRDGDWDVDDEGDC